MSRPEHLAPPEDFYDEKEARKYTQGSRITKIQSEMTQRCLELIGIPFNREVSEAEEEDEIDPENPEESESGESAEEEEPEEEDAEVEMEEEDDAEYLKPIVDAPMTILDLGCGSGLSGQMVSEWGHLFWGIDISPAMLNVAVERQVDGELMLGDLGHGFNFAPGFFDAAISVSALQWLCNSDKAWDVPWKRLMAFFVSLHKCLKLGGKAAIQFYPENEKQLEMVSNAAMKAGFAGGIYVDFPNSASAKKYYLVLSTAAEGKLGIVMKTGKTEEDEEKDDGCQKVKSRIKKARKNKSGKFTKKSKLWIYNKKEQQRKKGVDVRVDSKYTGRKRRRH